MISSEPSCGAPSRQACDQCLCELARAALRSSGYRLLDELDCAVSNGGITLSGSVPSFYLKQVAQAAILRLHCVKQVDNFLKVG